ncbi:ThiF family adenylyltransferase [Kitasatospora sp. NPDC094016]|uniref:ThiF family adenylyltransferase n=1 Tax=Kitasatospora sp. NPDC094016 TaxID=3154986 RepID=UPI003322033E
MTKRRPRSDGPNDWQRLQLAELKALADKHPGEVRVVGRPRTSPGGQVAVTIHIRTADMPRSPGGLRLANTEEFLLVLPSTPLAPPEVQTLDHRFAGTPHVLQGSRLCLYLDPAREWDPLAGVPSVMSRLWQWLTDAAAGKFDAGTALYHAVGGVLHSTPGTPAVVVREPVAHARAAVGWLTPRTAYRLDLTSRSQSGDSLRTPILTLEHALPLGAGETLAHLMTLIDASPTGTPRQTPPSGAASRALLTALAASALRNPEGTAQHFVLAVPHPAAPRSPLFLLAGRLPSGPSDLLRQLARRATPRHLSALPAEVSDVGIEWCYLSDERPAVTTRRDAQRPVHAFDGRHVHIWGCGGIGSWAAELMVRAGASRLTLSDPGRITGGLLVRQNYTEDHIGMPKAHALAQRLASIRDDVSIDVAPQPPSPELLEAADHADLILDATISVTVARFLDQLAQRPHRKAVLAQLAVDTRTASLGILTLVAPGTHWGPSAVDQAAGRYVLATPDLEPYHGLWAEPAPGDELRPVRGCSVPTFHGSAADLMATTATLVNLLGTQMRDPVSGTHLCAQPHTGVQPAHWFLAHGAPALRAR